MTAATDTLHAVGRLAVRAGVEAFALFFFASRAGRWSGRRACRRRRRRRRTRRSVTPTALAWIQTCAPIERRSRCLPVDPVGREARAAERGDVEHAGQQRAEDAADAVHAEHVERVVGAEHAASARSRPTGRPSRRARPMTNAPIGCRRCRAAGVIATRPATAPDAAPSIEGLPLNIHSPNDPATAPRRRWRGRC